MGETLLRWFVYVLTTVMVVWAVVVLGLVGRGVVRLTLQLRARR